MFDSLGPGTARYAERIIATSRARPMVLSLPPRLRTNCQRRLAAENDPWRFRQQSSRVISIQFWYLTSLVTSLSAGSDPFVSQWRCAKPVSIRRIFAGSVLALIFLGAGRFTCTLVSPLCTCIIAPAFAFYKMGYSIKSARNLCLKRRFAGFSNFCVDFPRHT